MRQTAGHTSVLETHPIRQVVDSTDRGRVAIAKSELGSLLKHEHLAAVPVLVLANKQVCAARPEGQG